MFKFRSSGGWEQFWELFKESIIIQSLVTLIILVTICVMYIMGREVSQELWGAFILILGYWFGAKNAYMLKQARRGQGGAKEDKDCH
jgi:hypothetical protein